ncbi:MAG: Gfo/Idh/MocA family oxidoreductase, partial [Chloroflexota bacterium]|nr:Gfo/Idh/MocA family oxidoreductase [Chloroflexota bacterium]
MAELGVSVIGLGRMGAIHARNLAHSVRGARLMGAAVDAVDLRELERSGSAPCPLTADVEALVSRADVDAVVVASPSSLHAEHLELVCSAGKAVFCEKPLAETVEQAVRAADQLRGAGTPFQIGFQRRYDPGYARARELIESGAIGRPELFRGVTCDRIPPVEYLRTSGGLFWDLGVHDFDAARYLTRDEVVAVHAVGSVLVEPRLAELDDVDYGVVTLRFARGGLGIVQNSWRAPWGYEIRAEVYGSEGKVVTELDERVPVRLYDHRGRTAER